MPDLENKYRSILLGLEVRRATCIELIGLFGMTNWSDRIARNNFLRAWREIQDDLDNIELLLLLLVTMSTQEVNEFIESFYWGGYHVKS
jgi:hypothetical protein